MFGIFGGEGDSQGQSTVQSLYKQIEKTTDLPEDLKSDNSISEDEKQARSLANAIAEASERSGGGDSASTEPDAESKIKHPFSSGLNTEYKGLANQLNSWEENNQAIYRFEKDRL